MLVFYLPYKINSNKHSTPNIRPIKLGNAFEKSDEKTVLIFGTIMYRISKTLQLLTQTNKKNLSLYVESGSVPIAFTNFKKNLGFSFVDYLLIYLLTIKSKKSGIFIRDIHYLFRDIHEYRSQINKFIYRRVGRIELFFFSKTFDVFFLPTLKMRNYLPLIFNEKEVYEAPPGLLANIIPHKTKEIERINILYVGGISEIYNFNPLLEMAFHNKNIYLTINVEKNVYLKFESLFKNVLTDRIKITHKFGDGLTPLYKEADICSLYFEPHEYHKFMSPYKLYEYISYGKPIIASQNSAFGEYVSKHDLGWVLPTNRQKAINILMTITQQEIRVKANNVLKIQKNLSWSNRAFHILSKLKN